MDERKVSFSATFALDPRRYLVTGALTGKSAGDYGQVYISTVCQRHGSGTFCGVRGGPADPPEWKIANLGINEILAGAYDVTVTIDADGGFHRAEGAIFDITRPMTRAFAVHRPDSGEVVHVHLHPSDLEIEVDEILTMVDPSHDAHLEVVEVPADQLPRAGFVVEKGRLVEQKGTGAGAGGTDAGEHGKRSYEDVRRREPS